jgi:ATP-dependent helicase/nuclease subunit B
MILSNKPIEITSTDRFIFDQVKEGKAKFILSLVPTNRKARKLKKEFISISPNQSVTEINIETLTTLATKLLSFSENFHSLDDATSSYLLRQSVESIEPKYFKDYKENVFPQGTLEKIRNVISEYKRTGITPEKLLDEVQSGEASEAEKLKAIDIAEIYSIYSRKCAELKAYEVGDVYARVLQFSDNDFHSAFRKLFPEVETITVSYFREISLPEVNLISKIIKSLQVNVLIEIYYSKQNKQIYEALEPSLERLRNTGELMFTATSSIPSDETLGLIEDSLFLSGKKITPKRTDKILFFYGKDKVDEIEKLAKKIKDLVINKNVEPSKIAVVANLIGDYSALIRTVFSSYEIPFNLSDRLTLEKSPVISAIMAWLEISENDFYYKNIYRALSSGYSSKLNIDVYNIQKVFQKHKLIAGYDFIVKVLTDLSHNDNIPPDEAIQISNALSGIRKINRLLTPFEKELTTDQFLEALKEFILKTGITETLLRNRNINGEENIKAVTSFLNGITAVFELVKKEYGTNTEHSLSFYIKRLKTIISWVRFNIKERSDFGVQVTSVDEIRGINYDYIFLCGMNDGVFPSKYSPEIFFADKFMKLESEHLAEERYKFFSVFRRFNKELILSYAKSDNKRELTCSTFLSDLSEIIKLKKIPESFFRMKLFSKTEALIESGSDDNLSNENIFNDDAADLKRKIAVENERVDGKANFYSGSLFNEEPTFMNKEFSLSEKGKAVLRDLKDKSFSVTQFENYAKCPFKYFVEKILRIEVIEDPNEDVEPLEIGNYLHALLFEFYTRLVEEKIDIHSQAAEDLLFDLAKNIISQFRFDDETYFYEKEKFFGISNNRADSILFHFLETERNQTDGYSPSYFEVAFGRREKKGSDKRLGAENPLQFDGINLVGKIDRVELKNNFISIVDYKTGAKKVTSTNIHRGLDLQLPVYMHIAEELLGPGFLPGKIFIYSLKFNEKDFGKNEINLSRKKNLTDTEKSALLTETVEESLSKLKEYFHGITSAEFNPSILDDRETLVCNYCNFKNICRVDIRESK